MMPSAARTVLASLALTLCTGAAFAEEEKPVNSSLVAETVYNVNRTKILQSNTSSLRPGSVYDVVTYFESLLRAPRPGYNYEFIDSGLGATEPLYPMMQKGHQASYMQLAPAFFFDARHIDHQSSLETPEGCKVDSAYLLRNITEYPDHMFKKERAEGYTRVVVRLEHYTKLRADAECGRHVSHDPDPNFDPMKYMWENRDAMYLEDFPQKDLQRFEAKLSVNFPMVEERGYDKRPRFDLNDLKRNSLWYYPDGHAFDYGLDTPRPQKGLTSFQLPRQMVVQGTPELQAQYPLRLVLKDGDFAKVLDYLNGKPYPDYDPKAEPGNDTFSLADVTKTNVYTHGLQMVPIKDVKSDTGSMDNFRLVGMTFKPQEPQLDADWAGERIIPQLRFVYQMVDPNNREQVTEQLFLHLKYDTTDRTADEATRKEQQSYFLSRLDQVTKAREAGGGEEELRKFVAEFTSARPVHSVSFSSALTGIWIFGNLERDNTTRELLPLTTVRHGIDYGFYSSVYDNDLLRAEMERSTGARKEELQQALSSLKVDTFRDPKRQDVHALRFNTVSCAQCHQMSGRDGVHMSLNDGINSKVTSPTIVSEYFFRDADAQLKGDMEKFLSMKN
ncbi:hypothetical protein [Terrihabitans rhizophilus]|uniref:Cytochrome c domain-containing protein n=1 Tax=Terrihabitans rhizophilus TaxID=3092662 RepID=A0ABU4RJH9_9HYPH|nr:hypothetical protein [Terrihabitans sp. PJ23]MDX6804997.1 hypothetical protein [Terrihabitans sp. PJ23]